MEVVIAERQRPAGAEAEVNCFQYGRLAAVARPNQTVDPIAWKPTQPPDGPEVADLDLADSRHSTLLPPLAVRRGVNVNRTCQEVKGVYFQPQPCIPMNPVQHLAIGGCARSTYLKIFGALDCHKRAA